MILISQVIISLQWYEEDDDLRVAYEQVLFYQKKFKDLRPGPCNNEMLIDSAKGIIPETQTRTKAESLAYRKSLTASFDDSDSDDNDEPCYKVKSQKVVDKP